MRHAKLAIGPLLLAVGLLLGFGAGCSDTESRIDGYVALVPRILRIGEREAVSLTLFNGDKLASGPAQVRLLQDGREVLTQSAELQGKGTIEFDVPPLPEGDYEIEVRGEGFSDKASVQVQEGSLLFLETDKPIYKPGQTLHVRLISLNSELKPMPVEATVDLQDAKGTKVFKKTVQTDEYGMATLDVPISEEPNLGVWKVSAQAGERSAELDVRVEEYVLPKYEVALDLPKEWFLVNEPITGKVRATYSYGKPVRGTLHIDAQRYVGQWEKFASFSADIDGEADFELPAVEYVAGVPEERGMGNVTLEITVDERATGYEEKTTRLLTVSESPVSLQLIPEGSAFKPSLPFTFLVVTETPDNKPVESQVSVEVTYLNEKLEEISRKSERVQTDNGLAMLTVTPPEKAVALMAEANTSEGAYTFVALDAAYSPSGNFIHVEQASEGTLRVGDKAAFKVHSTREAANFYYEVVARGRVVFSDFSRSSDISFTTTPLMAPSSRLLVYQILPNSEVAADYIPFDVEGDLPQSVTASFSQEQVQPGDALDVLVQTQGPAKVGLVAVDRSVFILAENRLNLQQVFDELERLYMEPQAELHEATPYEGVTTRGAQETFEDAGLVVLSNKKVPKGKEYQSQFKMFGGEEGIALEAAPRDAAGAVPAPTAATSDATGLAEVQRIRQYFPETWIWTDVMTDAQGRATLPVEAPDSITTWALRAVALSKENGLGIAEGELTVLQPFFIQADLPYSAVRGEEFPVKVALYNYLDQPQEFQVEMEKSGWFEAPAGTSGSITVGPNDVGSITFTIQPTQLGVQEIKVTARSPQAADAVVKNLAIVPEGVEREVVQNAVLSAGSSTSLGSPVPLLAVDGSARAYLALTGSFLTQTIEGLDQLLQMPFGCGEQNMLLFAPDVFIARYLKETNQLKPEVMAKAEKLMITGYQRELTYRRSDGSFSAFGENDEEGSLWLTAFVLKTFAQARDLMFIDDDVLSKAREWIAQQQRPDGSFEAVGFVHHQDMVGGVQGKTALTAYVAIALMEAGETSASAKAIDYLEGELAGIDDPYTMAIVAYALELAESPSRDQAHDQLMAMAKEDDDGLHWGSDQPIPLQEQPEPQAMPMPEMFPEVQQSTVIEATGYATLALNTHGDRLNASRATRWLVTRRNAYGGFGSTQDTVVALQALTENAAGAAADVDLTVTVETGGQSQQVTINADNFDVLQVLDVPAGSQATVRAEGRGEVVVQHVTRFNLPQAEEQGEIFKIDVDYGTGQVAVNDTITVDTRVTFNPPEPLKAGMVIVDVAVPTGFEPVRESIEAAVAAEPRMKRFDVAGRKVIFYIEDMEPGDSISFSFQARALYPVRAKGVASQAYSYYNPQWRGETLSDAIAVSGGAD
jgi:CD109 antigen